MTLIYPCRLPQYTHYAAAFLFLFFGLKMLKEAQGITHTGASGELEELEAELGKKEDDADDENTPALAQERKQRMDANFIKPILIQAFTLTFLAEWGDRSQIATVALVSCPTVSILS